MLYGASICGMDFWGLLVLVKLSDNYANLLAKYYFNWKLPDYWYSLHNCMTLPSLTKFTDFSSLKYLLRLCFVKILLIMQHETGRQLVSHRIFAISLKENKNSWSTLIFIILISSVLPIQQQHSVQI